MQKLLDDTERHPVESGGCTICLKNARTLSTLALQLLVAERNRAHIVQRRLFQMLKHVVCSATAVIHAGTFSRFLCTCT